jgi:hypothetical protein
MDADKALEIVEQVLLSWQLSPTEQLVLRQSCMGKSYDEMAQDYNYSSNYFKEIGSKLWHNLSNALGQRVTKKNINLALRLYVQKQREQNNELQQDYLTEDIVIDNLPELVLSNSIINTHIEYPSSPLPANSFFYINRPPVEELACAELNRSGCVIRIKAPQKMGKSSLLNLMVQNAKFCSYQTAYLDFQEADKNIFTSLDKLLRWFCANISEQLQVSSKIDDYWDEDIGSKVSCKIYFQDYLFKEVKTPIVIILNEVNRLFEYACIASDFLPMLRFWHEMARSVEIWQKLRLVIAHSTEVYIPLNLYQSPFNVGLAIKLPYFTSEQVQYLANRYQLDWINHSQIEQLMQMVGGHPYLINVALYHLHQGKMTLEQLLQAAPTQAGIYSDYLRGHLVMLQQQPELLSALQQVLTIQDGVFLDAIAAYKLESMGLIQLDGNQASLSCELYRIYFRQQL